MPEAALVPTYLKSVADEHGFCVYDCLYGSIALGREFPIEQSSGSVYGIWVSSSMPPQPDLAPVPGYSDWYPIYWGKDIAPASRMKAHVQGHKNGNINLPNIQELKGERLVYGAIFVSSYERFEKLVRQCSPPMLGTPLRGRVGSVVKVRDET